MYAVSNPMNEEALVRSLVLYRLGHHIVAVARRVAERRRTAMKKMMSGERHKSRKGRWAFMDISYYSMQYEYGWLRLQIIHFLFCGLRGLLNGQFKKWWWLFQSERGGSGFIVGKNWFRMIFYETAVRSYGDLKCGTFTNPWWHCDKIYQF